MINLINEVVADHEMIRTELTRIIAGWQREPQHQGASFTGLAHIIRVHVDFMTTNIHPAIDDQDDASTAIQDAGDDYQALAEVLDEIERLDPRDDEWLTMVKEVEANLDRRFSDDETTIIPIMERAIDDHDNEQLTVLHQHLMAGTTVLSHARTWP